MGFTSQQNTHAHYTENTIQIEAGDLDEVCSPKQLKLALYLGIIERAHNQVTVCTRCI